MRKSQKKKPKSGRISFILKKEEVFFHLITYYGFLCFIITDPLIPEEPPNEDRDNYYSIISRNKELMQMIDMLMHRVKNVMNAANKYKQNFNDHAYLWQESRAEYMHYFLTYGRQLTQEELDQLEEDEKAVKKQVGFFLKYSRKSGSFAKLIFVSINVPLLRVFIYYGVSYCEFWL